MKNIFSKIKTLIIYKFLPLFIVKLLFKIFGNLKHKNLLGLNYIKPYYAYGLIQAVEYAKKYNFKAVTVIEFGVASGRGIYYLSEFKEELEKFENIKINIFGFDTGKGMPKSSDYRDHPDKFNEGDYSMLLDKEKIESYGCKLIIGDIKDTLKGFHKELSRNSPIGFLAFDLDTYNSCKSALKLFNYNENFFLPYVFCYFDDCDGRHHFTKFTGELLAIEEFNKKNKFIKIDNDRGIWNHHKLIPKQVWYDRCFIAHFFKHNLRYKNNFFKKKKILPKY